MVQADVFLLRYGIKSPASLVKFVFVVSSEKEEASNLDLGKKKGQDENIQALTSWKKRPEWKYRATFLTFSSHSDSLSSHHFLREGTSR